MLGILECHTGLRSVVRMGVMRGIMRAVGAIMRSPNMHRRFKLAANVQTAVEFEPDRHQVCNTRNLLARTHNPAAAKMRSRGCGSSEPDLVVTASDQRPDAVAAAAVTMRMWAVRVWTVAPHHLHHWVRFRRRKRIGAVRWQSGRRGHTDRANEDRRKNVAHLVTPFGPIDSALRPTRCLAQFAPA